MMKYSEQLRSYADLLDEDFKGNVWRVVALLAEMLHNLIRYELQGKP